MRCFGFRVHGPSLQPLKAYAYVFLCNPQPDRHKLPDLRATLVVPAPKQPYKATLVLVSDSSINEDAFLIGFLAKLRKAGVFVLQVCVQNGARATDLSLAWHQAPTADFGLTIYGGNDFLWRNTWDEQIDSEVLNPCDLSQQKTKKSIFCMNNAAFFQTSIHRGSHNGWQKLQRLFVEQAWL